MNFLADLLSMGKSSHAYYRLVKVTGPLSSGKLAPEVPKAIFLKSRKMEKIWKLLPRASEKNR